MRALLSVDRRQMFAGIGTAATLLLPGCATTMRTAAPRFCLPGVKVAENRVIRTLVGLRPWRPSGFVVRAERFGTKRLVHNYGHGGAGITLSWGTARLALDLALPGHQGAVAVIGAGVVGLTTARLAQEAGHAVTIYAAELPPNTTSDIAGGEWYPASLYRRSRATAEFLAQLGSAAAYSYRRFQIMAGNDYGIRWMTKWELADSADAAAAAGPDYLTPLLPDYEVLKPGQHPFGSRFVRRFQAMMIEPPVFLRQMLRDFMVAGGKVVVRRFASASEWQALPEDLIVNCTGLGARELVGDTELTAMRGQLVVLLPQPEVDYAVSSEDGAYMFSRSDGVLLGGTFDIDDWRLEPDPAQSATILAAHKQIFAQELCA